MKVYNLLIIALLLSLVGACTDKFEEFNQDPSAITGENIEAKYFITKAQVNLIAPNRYPYWRGQLIHADRYAGQFCFGFNGSWWSDALGYSYSGGYTNATWDYFEGYTGTLVTYLQITGEGGDRENPLAYAVGLVMRSLYFMYFTDTFGEIPYSETGSLDVLLPKFDTQKDIYSGMITDLTLAIETIGSATTTGELNEDLGENDLFFGGDLQKWKALANTLKLRLALRANGAEGDNFSSPAITEAMGGSFLEDFEDNALLPKDNVISQWNSAAYGDVWHNFGGYGSKWTVSKYVINYLQDNADPRLEKYAKPAPGGEITIPQPESDDDALYAKRRDFILANLDEAGAVYTTSTNENGETVVTIDVDTYYIGQPPRLNGEMYDYNRREFYSMPADYIVAPKNESVPIAPEVVVSSADAYFMRAEAVVKGFVTGDANALYRSGLEQAMLLWGVAPDDITTFLADSPMANLTGANDEEMIAIQRWLINYTEGFEAWAIVRDTGFPTELAAGVDDPDIYGMGDLNGKYPQRMRYGTNAYTTNGDNLEEALERQGVDLQATTLWWAK
ncbi:SusD/RagB family nutrient-binding outer membrane lipoprotein [Carboxylicivirga sediminis]|uniref:SusD/RagB family nutrient-binding outer membrane lipoprotein n=1 Tax=Carboxylicivirga sediminis TaxID=2006564 RepID=A0A941IUW0_9BACT|nr:SusD/RagB family nutrient-binding outer membrane lipoprotein [Carboxylicivirga sediminis]MBR8534871.1 SusD/RagB family nutrient-binding outer membrane lipoprotein [Carboxylicivirga sediminis]